MLNEINGKIIENISPKFKYYIKKKKMLCKADFYQYEN